MLLLYFIKYNVFTSGLPKLGIYVGSWDRGKEKHVEEDEHYEENIVSLVVLDGQYLKVRIEIVGCQSIHMVYHSS